MTMLVADDQEYTLETREASSAHLLTKVESFSMLSPHKIEKLESTEFEAGDYKWQVTINLDEDDYVSAYLSMVGTNSLPAGWEVNAIFNLFLYNHISDNYRCFHGKARCFHAINSKWGFSKLITKKSLAEACNGYLFEDKCVFGAEVFLIKKQLPLIENVSVLKLSDIYKREFKISEFSKMKEIWYSEELSAGGYKWKIMLYPNGNGRACDHYVSIFLKCVDSESFGGGKKVNAKRLFCFRNQLDDKRNYSMEVREWFTSSSPNWGYVDFIAVGDMRDPCKGFVVDDCCILEIQLSALAVQE